MKKLQTSKKTYFVNINEDGSLFISYNGKDSIQNAGLFVNSMGGIEAILARCEDKDYTPEEVEQYLANKAAYLKDARKRQIERDIQKREERAKLHKAAFDALVTASPNGVIETTRENISIVIHYLNDCPNGDKLPMMSIGYSYNQYDCDGKLAGAIKLDRPIQLEDTEEMVSKFQVGAPMGYLSKYHRC